MKLVKAYAPTSNHDDEETQQFYEDVELAMRKVQTYYIVVMGDFNAKVGKKCQACAAHAAQSQLKLDERFDSNT